MPKPPGLSRIPLRWRAPGLRERLLAYLIVFWFLPVLIGASALLVVQRREAQADAIRHLEVLAGSREAVLQDWRANALEHANELAAIVALCLPDVTGQACDLQEKVSLEVAAHDIVVEVSLLDPVTGEVIFSSDPAQEGKIRAREDYFISGLAGPSLSRVFYDLTLDAPTQMASVPVRNRAGALVSVVALRLNVHRLDTRIVADTGLGKIGDVYLVNRNGLLLTSSRYEAEGILRQVISSDGAKRALAGESGWAFYDDYRGIPVLGVYRWLPEANQALLVEVDRGMVFRGQQIVLLATLSLASVFLLAGVGGAIFVSRGVSRPLTDLAAQATRISAGDLDARVPLRGGGELKRLGQAFNEMAASIQGTQAALAASEARYRALVDWAEDIIFTLDRDGRYTAINASTLRRFGWTEADFVGKNIRDFYSPEEVAFREAQYTRVFETGQPVRFERRSVNESGDFWFSISLSPIFDLTGDVVAISGVSRDITERVQGEAALREAHQLLGTIFDHTHMMLAYLDPQFNFIRVNRAYALADERKPSFFPGKNHFDLYPNEENEAIFRQVVETGETHFSFAKPFEYAEYPERGVSYWDWALVPLKGSNDQVQGLILTLLNVTERVQAEAALLLHAQRLETLRAANLALSQSLDLDTVVETMLDHLGKLVPYDSANVMLTIGYNRRETGAAVYAIRGHEAWTDPSKTRTISFDAKSNPVIQALLTTQKSLLIPDTREYPGWERPRGAGHVLSWLGVPLVAGGEVIGLYSVDKAEAGFFTEKHLQLAEALAAQAAVAIQNARLHEQAQHHAEELEARVAERTAELRTMVNLMSGREVRMAELKDVIHQLRAQLEAVGLTPAADDPLLGN